MNTSRRYIISLVASVVVLAAGCSLPGKSPATPRRTYLLQDQGRQDGGQAAAFPATDARPCLNLRVSTPSSAPGYGTTRMVYVKQPPRLDYFAYHEWADTPARMVQAMMENHLTSSGLFGAVLSGSTDVRTDLRLDAELQKLEQDFTGAGSTLVLGIKVEIVDMASRSLLAARSFTYTETAGEDAESAVVAADRAAQQFLADLTTFVAAAIKPLECALPAQ